MIIVGSLGVALSGGGVVECPRRLIQHLSHARGPAIYDNLPNLARVIGGECSFRPGRSKVCERDLGGEVSRDPPFREGSRADPSVRSTISSVGVDATGDVDLEGATTEFRLGSGMHSSSSEEMTCIAPDRALRHSIGYVTTNPQSRFGQPANEPNTTNNAKWKIGPPQDAPASDSLPPHTSL